MTVPQRSGLESCGHKVTVGKTILSIGKVSTFDFMGFSIQPASRNLMFRGKFNENNNLRKFLIISAAEVAEKILNVIYYIYGSYIV